MGHFYIDAGRRAYCCVVLLQAIARKLQEKEMKEDRRRHKQLETRFDEDHGGEESTADLCKCLIYVDLWLSEQS